MNASQEVCIFSMAKNYASFAAAAGVGGGVGRVFMYAHIQKGKYCKGWGP